MFLGHVRYGRSVETRDIVFYHCREIRVCPNTRRTITDRQNRGEISEHSGDNTAVFIERERYKRRFINFNFPTLFQSKCGLISQVI